MERSFTGNSGREWSFDPDQLLGDPGGFGSVHPGRADEGEPVAVKVISLIGRISAPGLLRREAEIGDKLRGVRADHLVRMLDSAETDTEVLLVMERAERSLKEHLGGRDGRVPSAEAASILRDVTAGLRELHQASVIHRDLKPGNVLLHEGRWKLSDFGIARDADIGTQNPTFIGIGSLPYMAPETWRGQSPTFKTDLYSLGCTAFELLHGGPPFSGPEGEDFRRQHLEEAPPELTSGPAALRRIIVRLLSKEPAERHQDARAVEEALARVPLTGEEESAGRGRLAELALQHSRERAAEQAEESAAHEAEEQRRALLKQAGVDLDDVLQEAVQAIQGEIPEVAFEWRGTVASVAGADAALNFRFFVDRDLANIRFDTGVEGDAAIAFGEVTGNNRRMTEDALLANALYEDDGEGLFRWFVYRFRAQGALTDYPLGPMDREHGLSLQQFLEHRRYMLGSATHIFTTVRNPLTVGLVSDLYAEALAIQGGPR